MIRVDALRNLITQRVQPLPLEWVPLSAAQGRILREPILASEDMPAFDRSAVDGYAVRLGDLSPSFHVCAECRPGRPAPPPPSSGQALRIFTGSALPPEVTVWMQEDVLREGDRLQPPASPVFLNPSLHIRRRASHCRKGDVLLSPGTPIDPSAIAVLATNGTSLVPVSQTPRVVHLLTGSELVDHSKQPGPGEIRDSNGPLLAALLREAGAQLLLQTRVSEAPEAALQILQNTEPSQPHLFLLSGGASVGDHDHTHRLLQSLGFEIHCAKVASRPGKPLLFATRGSQIAFGLPGNPVSHLVCFHLFVRRALEALQAQSLSPLLRVQLKNTPSLADARETWAPARLFLEDTVCVAEPLPWQDSSDLTRLAYTNALVRIPTEPSVLPVADALWCGPTPL